MDAPYSLELQDQYTSGPKPKKIPSIKGTFHQGKPATNKVLEHFVRATPVVERCDDPRCISRLVIVPKLDPGMPKSSPPTSCRVTMNAIINDCLKPVASTLPLATDEIKKLHGFKYFIKADAMHAHWSIPLDDESKKLLCFLGRKEDRDKTGTNIKMFKKLYIFCKRETVLVSFSRSNREGTQIGRAPKSGACPNRARGQIGRVSKSGACPNPARAQIRRVPKSGACPNPARAQIHTHHYHLDHLVLLHVSVSNLCNMCVPALAQK